jgi:superfamily II DNA or RNA helicase
MQIQDHIETPTKQAFLLRPYQQRAVEWAKTGADGLIVAPAGCGKTVIASHIIKYLQHGRPGWRFGWLAPTRETCDQARASLRAVGVPDEVVEIRCPHESVDFSQKDVLIVDEAKHSPAISWRRIIESCRGFRYGFDATPWCDDPDRNAAVKDLFNQRIYEIKRDELANVLAHANVYLSTATDVGIQQRIDDQIEKLFADRKRYMRIRHQELRAMCAWEAITDIGICQNKTRNDAAIIMATAGGPKQPTLVLVPRVTLGEHYALSINRAVLVHSKMPKKARREAMEEFKAGNISVMIATSLADEGLDLPNVHTLVMVSGGRSAQKTIQRASRALRRCEGKDTALICDFKDTFHPLAESHAKKRIKCYKELGCSIQ